MHQATDTESGHRDNVSLQFLHWEDNRCQSWPGVASVAWRGKGRAKEGALAGLTEAEWL
jgi:hypothetical protein